MERYDPVRPAKEAVHEAGEVARAAASEGQTQAQTPEMQQAGAAISRAGHAAADQARHARERVSTSTQAAAERARERVDDLRETVRETREAARERVDHVREEVKVRAEAVQESGRRAAAAPGRIKRELRSGYGSWLRGIGVFAAMLAAAAVIGIVAFIVLTIGLVVTLNVLLGDPWGTLVLAVIYLVLAGIAVAAGRAAMRSGREAREKAVENSKEELRGVARPVRTAFQGRGRAGT